MLYIFHVDTGKMMPFDMNLALESVKHLKEVIERSCGIPVDKQVLLVSGGDCLDPAMRVCSYSAGTDTNPIYLFSKSTIESQSPPSLSIDFGPDLALKEQVEATHNMNDTYTTVVARVQLAQKFCDHAHEQSRACESLVHDQHLQQQGWMAVLANLEDITQAFRNRAELFEQSFSQHLETRMEYLKLLENFRADMDMLAKIPLIPALLETGEDKAKMSQIENAGGDNEEKQPVTLLDWVSANNQSSLYQVAQTCMRNLEQLDQQVIETLKAEVEKILDHAIRTDMKEIKGLEERLYGLEQLMLETKRIVQEQVDLTQSFLSNQTRANVLGDASILPDLCASHRRQLVVMLSNHQHLLDIRGRCTRAKEELCHNLHARLKWVMYVENQMCDVGTRLMIYSEKLKKLRRLLDVIQQVHLCPKMYVNAVGEVVRRRTFSQAFLMWASDLACQLLAVHNEEVARRKDFQSQFEGHFLNTLFPGMEDLPPPFATQAPSPFDSGLPKLTAEDMERLQAELPELTFSVCMPDLQNITQFFLVRSVKTEDKGETTALEDTLVKVVTDAGLASHLDPTLLQPAESTPRDQDRGFESETDTEEFEKVGQSPIELAAAGGDQQEAPENSQEVGVGADSSSPPHSSTPPFTTADFYIDESMPSSYTEAPELIRQLEDTNTLVALLQENLGNTRNEVERLRGQLRACGHASTFAVSNLRGELAGMRLLMQQEQVEFGRLQAQLVAALGKRCEAENVHRQEQLQRLTLDHELELDSLRKEAEEGKRKLKQHEEELSQLQEQNQNLQQQLEGADSEKQRALKELNDRLTHSYKTELEGLRSRFRLMATASMERSPSDSSLEKIERPDVIELVNHEAIVAQIREDLVTERDSCVNMALERERAQWETRLEHELKQARLRCEAEKQVWFNEAMRRVVDDKDRQLEAMRSRESSLLEELERHRESIRQLTDARECSSQWPLLERVDALEADKALLQQQLAEERDKMNTSVAVVQEGTSSRDAATSPEPSPKAGVQEAHPFRDLSQSTTSLIQQGKISIVTCNAGDAVVVVWDEKHGNYIILQESPTLYFLHSDCLEMLGLRPSSDGSPRRLYNTGKVVDKEYCQAKKSENRYRVPKGTKFYRVKVRPLRKDSSLSRSHHHHHHHHLQSNPPQELACSQEMEVTDIEFK